jgi:hypothetical protein
MNYAASVMTPEDIPDAQETGAKAKAAEHIALEASRLARIANANDFGLLAYLIDMVVLEAWREASEAGVEKGPALADG